MMDRSEKALELKHRGHNCCQAVLCTYAAELGLSEEVLRKLGTGFGAGMGCMEGTCGALCGAEMVLGLAKFEGKPVMRDAAALHRAFAEKCGATLCKDLKGRDTGVVICDCDSCVRNAVLAYEELS